MYCTKCEQEKDKNEFRIRETLKRGYQSWCKSCENDLNKSNYIPKPKRNREPYDPLKALKRMLKYRYNLTYDEYKDIYNNQKGKCAICGTEKILGTKKGLLVDHDHNTNKIRGLLCTDCNSGIGKLKENIQILQNSITYLQR